MTRPEGTRAVRSCLVVLSCLVALPATAAEASRPAAQPQAQTQAQAQKKAEELGEVLVEGRRAKVKPPGFKQYEQTFDWLARLVGRFVIEGTVDLHAQGRSEDLRKVSGRAECIGFGSAPGVQCEWKIRWPDSTGPNGEAIPGGVSNLNPSAALFGLELVRSGISWMLIDDNGVAETTVGEMKSADTMHSRARCGAISGNCQRVSRITAAPDLKTVDLRMDLEIDEKVVVSYALVMHRVPGAPSIVYGRKQEKAKKK